MRLKQSRNSADEALVRLLNEGYQILQQLTAAHKQGHMELAGQKGIVNRWGEKVFSTTNPNTGWNGTHNGDRVNDGVFAYRLHVLFTDGKEEDLKGNVTLVR